MAKEYINHSLDILTSHKSGFKKGSKGSGLISLFGYKTEYDLSRGEMPVVTTKKLFTKAVTHEMLWFMKGNTNIKYLEDNKVRIWRGNAFEYNLPDLVKEGYFPKGIVKYSKEWDQAMVEYGKMIREDKHSFAERFGDSGPIYPKQWRHWPKFNKKDKKEIFYVQNEKGIFVPVKNQDEIYRKDVNGIDQFENFIEGLKKKPSGKKHIVSAWNPADVPDMSLPPCHVLYQASMDENGGLELSLYQRSSDMFLGVPFNDYEYGVVLMNIIAKEVGGFPKRFIHHFGDTHFYLGLEKRAKWYKENMAELKKRVSDDRNDMDFSSTLEWIDKNAPRDADYPNDPEEEKYDHVTAILEQASKEPLPGPKFEVADKSWKELTIDDFKLIDYNSQDPIRREMLV